MVAKGKDYYANRTAHMVHWYKQGCTLQEIGDEFGISRERVRQILFLQGIKGSRPHSVDPVQLMQVARTATSLSATCRKATVSITEAKQCFAALGVLPALERLWSWRRKRRHRTDEQLLDRMRVIAAQVGHVPTKADMDSYKPTTAVYQRRFGSLSAAQRAAGFTPTAAGKRPAKA